MKLKQQKQFQFSNINSKSTKSNLFPFSVPGRLSPDGSAISWSILKSDYRLKNAFLLFRYLFVPLPGNTVLVLKGFDCHLQVILPQHPVLDLLFISETHQGRPLQIFQPVCFNRTAALCILQILVAHVLQAHLYLYHYFIVHVPHYFFLNVSIFSYPFLSLPRQHLYFPFGINNSLSYLEGLEHWKTFCSIQLG